jgi:hypothetical protein
MSQAAGEAEYANPNSNYWRQEVDACKDRIAALPIGYEELIDVVEKHLPGFIGDKSWQWIACQLRLALAELEGFAKAREELAQAVARGRTGEAPVWTSDVLNGGAK